MPLVFPSIIHAFCLALPALHLSFSLQCQFRYWTVIDLATDTITFVFEEAMLFLRIFRYEQIREPGIGSSQK